MTTAVQCPNCKASLRAPDGADGRMKCPKCHSPFTVAGPAPARTWQPMRDAAAADKSKLTPTATDTDDPLTLVGGFTPGQVFRGTARIVCAVVWVCCGLLTLLLVGLFFVMMANAQSAIHEATVSAMCAFFAIVVYVVTRSITEALKA